jgi:hypothetical protein
MSVSETGFVCPDCGHGFIAGSDYVERYGNKFCTLACAGLDEPDAHAALTEKLRALVKEWEQWVALENNRGCQPFAYIYEKCARDLSALIDGAK